MKKIKIYLSERTNFLILLLVIIAALAGLLLYKLGSLTGGLSITEERTAAGIYGFHGIYNSPFYLPLNFVRSVVFFLFDSPGQTLTRLPNVVFGGLTIVSFAWLIRLWHGNRTALFATLLFACAAWTLHVSRLASFDVLYLWVVPSLLLANALWHQNPTSKWLYYGNVALWGLMLYIPGIVWLILINLFWQRKLISQGWKHFNAWWQRLLYLLTGLVWLPLLVIGLLKADKPLMWLGLPAQFASPLELLRNLLAVPYHLFVRGPLYPELWLDRAPILDIFTLIVCIMGIYFYIQNRNAKRSKVLGSFFIIGVLLVAINGAVGISLLVPMLYIVAATGIAYLKREWLKVFPLNPFARTLGISLIVLAVILSCVYNLRAYYVAWPNNNVTIQTFRYHR